MGSQSKRIVLIVAVMVLAAQFVPINRTNPPVDPAKTLYATHPVPPEMRALFEHSCADCHSNQTTWPWYSRLAPFSWMIANDVHGGRKHFNLSEWGTYSDEKRLRKLGEICEQVKTEEMPDDKYTLIHRSARLNAEQRAMVCEWTDVTRKPLQAATGKQGVPSSDPHKDSD